MQMEVLPKLRRSIATGAAQDLGFEQKHHPLHRRSRLLQQTFGELRLIPTMGATSHLCHQDQGYNYIHVTVITPAKHMPIEACLLRADVQFQIQQGA
ncbi:hypothetical protein F2Q70_00029761 [Brassica cretica]|uniref:Uncharacterized protein n=1 Tax=Brassica cretica TaxID=69181 RepID=A0A8S9GXT2_BRACR|nr:hypothetical protein F2Q70_00029761 [Brassica cretica]KAF2550563.1 hypothetical protein F2Q68_00034223 [Brassica cretica]